MAGLAAVAPTTPIVDGGLTQDGSTPYSRAQTAVNATGGMVPPASVPQQGPAPIYRIGDTIAPVVSSRGAVIATPTPTDQLQTNRSGVIVNPTTSTGGVLGAVGGLFGGIAHSIGGMIPAVGDATPASSVRAPTAAEAKLAATQAIGPNINDLALRQPGYGMGPVQPNQLDKTAGITPQQKALSLAVQRAAEANGGHAPTDAEIGRWSGSAMTAAAGPGMVATPAMTYHQLGMVAPAIAQVHQAAYSPVNQLVDAAQREYAADLDKTPKTMANGQIETQQDVANRMAGASAKHIKALTLLAGKTQDSLIAGAQQ